MTPRPYVNDRIEARLRTVVRPRLFDTRWQLSDPKRSIQLVRAGVVITPDPVRVLLAESARLPIRYTDARGVDGDFSTGTLTALADDLPDVAVDDEFMVDGRVAVVVGVPPVARGLRTADYRLPNGGA